MTKFSDDQTKDLAAIGKHLLVLKEGEVTVIKAFGKSLVISCIKIPQGSIEVCRVATHRDKMPQASIEKCRVATHRV